MIDERQIAQWWQYFVGRGNGVVELRAIDGRNNWSGYFRDMNNLINSVRWLDEQTETCIYFTLNSVNEDCYDRTQCEHLESRAKNTTSDNDITIRRFVLIDLDPKRSVGINSSDEELALAKEKARVIYNYLLQQGFRDMLLAMSGNGYHLLIPCAITISDESTLTVKRFLQTLAWFFNDEKVEVDCSVFNPSRICKLYGTVAKKGRDSQKRPRRMAIFEYVPDEIQDTPIECFQRIASLYPEDNPAPSRDNGWGRGERFDLEAFLQRNGMDYRTETVSDGTKYILKCCPFNSNHTNKDAVIFQRQNGAIGFHCFHNSCQGKTWKDVRLLYEPNSYNRPSFSSDPYRPIVPGKAAPPPMVQKVEHDDEWLSLGDIPMPVYAESDYTKSGFRQIDDIMMGFRRGHVSVWCGKRGCGKSSILNEVALNAANTGCRTMIWSGELDPGELKKWFFLQAAAHHTRQSTYNSNFYYTPKEVEQKIAPWASQYIKIYNNKYGESEGNPYSLIESSLRTQYARQPYDMVILDNLMILGLDDVGAWNINEQQKKLMIRLHNLALELKVHLHLVAHPNKQQGFIRPDNISGTGHIADLAQNVFLMHRTGLDFDKMAKDFLPKAQLDDIKASGCTNIVEIAKCRDKGSAVGHMVLLYFDHRNNQLQEGVDQTIHYAWEEQPRTEQSTVADTPESVDELGTYDLNYDDSGNYIGDMPF